MPLVLPKMGQMQQIVRPDGGPIQQFQSWWNTAMGRIENAVNGLTSAIADITAAQAAADEANTALENGAILVKDEGGAGAETHTLNFVGDGVSATTVAGVATVTVSGEGAVRGALVKKAADHTAANYTGGVFITWDAEDYDTDSIHDTAVNPSRLTVPAGVTKVRLSGQVYITSSTSNALNNLQVFKNGSFTYNGAGGHLNAVPNTTANLQVFTPPLIVTSGDYFELGFTIIGDASITIEAEWSWFAMEILA